MPLTVRGGRIVGDASLQFARLKSLTADLERIQGGTMPTVGELAQAPLIDQYISVERPVPCLMGLCDDHPRLPGPLVTTTDIWISAYEDGWIRTIGRYYRLGRRRSD